MYDSVYRGTWVTLVASDREVEQLCIDKLKFKVTFKESDVCSLLTSAIANVAMMLLSYSSFSRREELRTLAQKIMNNE